MILEELWNEVDGTGPESWVPALYCSRCSSWASSIHVPGPLGGAGAGASEPAWQLHLLGSQCLARATWVVEMSLPRGLTMKYNKTRILILLVAWNLMSTPLMLVKWMSKGLNCPFTTAIGLPDCFVLFWGDENHIKSHTRSSCESKSLSLGFLFVLDSSHEYHCFWLWIVSW